MERFERECKRGKSGAVQEIDAFPPKRRAHRFEVHQMGATANLDVALYGRLRERVEEPPRRERKVACDPMSCSSDEVCEQPSAASPRHVWCHSYGIFAMRRPSTTSRGMARMGAFYQKRPS